jgi:hypothetical protein
LKKLLIHRHRLLTKFNRLVTAPARCGPDVLIVGAMKAGTTSLQQYLDQQPGYQGPFNKEVHYFDWRWRFGRLWYQAYFPTQSALRAAALAGQKRALTGEASPFYLFHPLAAQRIAAQYPEAKIIAILRHPIDRAVSHYHHEVRQGCEPLSMEEAFQAEAQRTARPPGRSLDRHYAGYAMNHHSYLARGQYAEQLQRFYEHFPPEQVLVLRFETFFADPAAHFPRVLEFLNLPVQGMPQQFERFNVGSNKADIPASLRQSLESHFAPHNRALRELTGGAIGWDD